MMLRRYLKDGIGHALSATAADRLVGSLTGLARRSLNASYHRVVEDVAAERFAATPAMAVSVAMFERQLDWIGKRRRFVSLDELGARIESGDPWNEPVATVTFDDGYANVLHHALPVLQRKGIPAAVFVITDWVGLSA